MSTRSLNRHTRDFFRHIRGEINISGYLLIILYFLLVIVINPSSLLAEIIHVPSDSATIQAGINGAVDGDTVMVAPGVYQEHDIDYFGKSITVMNTNPEDSGMVAITIIDACSLGRVLYFHSSEDSNSVLRGFTIRGGNANSGGGLLCDSSSPIIGNCIFRGCVATRAGGGLNFRYSSAIVNNCVIRENVVLEGTGGGIDISKSSPTISECTIIGNRSIDGAGGGIYCNDSSPIIKNCIISQDSAWSGGGLRLDQSSTTFTNCTISENLAFANNGGGIECFWGSSVFINCNINSNQSNVNGGGLYMNTTTFIIYNGMITNNGGIKGGGVDCVSSIMTMLNCIMVNNSANNGGALNLFNSEPTFTNCTISNNSASYMGGGVYCENSYPVITNSIYWNDSPEEIFIASGNDPIITYTDIKGGWIGQGNVDIDPLFRKPTFSDFHLMAVACGDSMDSPCIDIGTSVIVDSIMNCEWGLGIELSDLGAYGGGKSLVSIGDQEKEEQMPLYLTLSQNYPNPFNPTTTVSFNIAGEAGEKQTVCLDIYNLRGRHVKTLIDEALEPGAHHVVWDGVNEQGQRVSSGVYLYTLKSGSEKYTRKMVICK